MILRLFRWLRLLRIDEVGGVVEDIAVVCCGFCVLGFGTWVWIVGFGIWDWGIMRTVIIASS